MRLIPVVNGNLIFEKKFWKSNWGKRQTPEWEHKWLLQHFVGRFLTFLWPNISPSCRGSSPSALYFHLAVCDESTQPQRAHKLYLVTDASILSPCNTPQVHIISFYYLQILLITWSLSFNWNIFSAWEDKTVRRKVFVDLLW